MEVPSRLPFGMDETHLPEPLFRRVRTRHRNRKTLPSSAGVVFADLRHGTKALEPVAALGRAHFCGAGG